MTQGLNRYSYGLNNPSRYTDPSGHVATDASDGTGCGPECLLNHLIYKDEQDLNNALYEYFRQHPEYDASADSSLDPTDRSIIVTRQTGYELQNDIDDGTASLATIAAFLAMGFLGASTAGPRWAPTVNTDGDFYYTKVSCNSAQCTRGVDEATAGIYLAGKAPKQVTPGIRVLKGVYVNNQGKEEPWIAYYDEYGRLVGRTDYNAGNSAAGIADTHYHTIEYNEYYPYGHPTGDHIPGEYIP